MTFSLKFNDSQISGHRVFWKKKQTKHKQKTELPSTLVSIKTPHGNRSMHLILQQELTKYTPRQWQKLNHVGHFMSFYQI